MRSQDAFQVEGVVTGIRSERTCQVRLANGHVLFGFVAARDCARLSLALGQKVNLQLSPYDLSEGRILTDKEKI